jgi:hypothetical protein
MMAGIDARIAKLHVALAGLLGTLRDRVQPLAGKRGTCNSPFYKLALWL